MSHSQFESSYDSCAAINASVETINDKKSTTANLSHFKMIQSIFFFGFWDKNVNRIINDIIQLEKDGGVIKSTSI